MGVGVGFVCGCGCWFRVWVWVFVSLSVGAAPPSPSPDRLALDRSCAGPPKMTSEKPKRALWADHDTRPQFLERDPGREKKERNLRRGGKNMRNFEPPTLGAPSAPSPSRPLTLRAPHFFPGFAPTTFWAPSFFSFFDTCFHFFI